MKFPSHSKNKLSRPLVAFVAALVCNILHVAIAQGSTSAGSDRGQKLTRANLIAQAWLDVSRQKLSANSEVPNNAASSQHLSNKIQSEQKQLIAQAWSEIDPKRLSLTTFPKPQGNFSKKSSEIIISQLLPQQRLIAQVWTDVATEQLSLATVEQSNTAQNQTLPIAQRRSPKQQLIAQVWTDVELQELTLVIPSGASNNTAAERVLITQLLPKQQRLIAQVWSEVARQQLSLISNSGDRSENLVEEVAIARLPKAQQKLITQVWSDFDKEKLSLIGKETLPAIPPETTERQSARDLIALTKLPPQQRQTTQTWKKSPQKQLSLDAPIDELDRIAVLSSPFVEQPPPRVPSKEEIAARIVLNEVQIITPAPGVIVDGQSDSSVTIQYPLNTTVKLKVNGKQIDNALVTHEQLNFDTSLVTKTWQGAKLNEGSNQVSIIASKSEYSKEITREVIVKSDAETVDAETTDAETREPESVESIGTTTSEPKTESSTRSTVSAQPTEQLVKILTPKPDAVLKNIASSVIIQFPEEAKVILQVNGKSVNPSQVGRTEVNPVTKIVTQTWYGVIFDSGTNKLSVLATTDGKNYDEKAIEVMVPGKPDALEISTVESEIPADGKSIAQVKGRYVDDRGVTSVWNETITLNSSEGKFVGADLNPDQPGFQVRVIKGEFVASLQAGYDPKKVTIQAKAAQLEAFTQIQFRNTLREKPLLTGFANLRIGARGTDYYDSFRDFLPLDEDNSTAVDFDSAAFITGSLGRWTYTGAYNSDRPLNEDSRGETRIFRSYSQSESAYPIYGDSSTTEVTTPSIDNVYFRLERNSQIEAAESDYVVWGDYDTEEFATEAQEFSAITRQLHGFKSNYNLGGFQFNAIYGNNLEGFQRDGIAPDGTSGFYFLSRRLLIPGSEDIYLELTPLNDTGNIVERQRLDSGVDYEIDYDRGTLLFTEPILRTQVDGNGNILVRRIVATYQFESEASDSDLFAGRARYHFDRDFKQPSWLGTTYVKEDRGDQDFELYGFDALISFGRVGSISGEYANSTNQTIFNQASGSAYRFEGKVKFSENLLGRAYYRQASDGFANNATLSFIPGQTRFGGEINARISDRTSLNFLYERQENDGVAPRPLDELEDFLDAGFTPVPGSRVNNNLSTVTAGVKQKIGAAELGLDLTYRDRQDNTNTSNLASTSTQLRSRFSIPLVEKLTFHALNDLTLSDDTDAIFSDRIGVGLDWEFYSGLSLIANHQWFTRGNQAGDALTTIGLQGEYEPWANATLTGRFGITNGVAGINNTGSVGMQQKIPLAPGLDLDLNYERTFSNFDNESTGTTFVQPFSVGQGASALSFESGSTYGIGIQYTDNPDFTADAKFEYSNGDDGSNTVISAGVTGKLSKAITSLFSYNQASSANQTFDIGTTRNIRLGLAYRHPERDRFNALLRYEFDDNGGLIPETILLGNGTGSKDHLFAGEIIYAPNWRWEFYHKLAYRHSRTFIADDFVASSNVFLGQLRTTYRLNYHMDLVAEGRTILQPSAEYSEFGLLLEAGYYLTPELRLSAGYVFGSADDEDFTGTRSAGGPYLNMTVKLNSLLDGFGQHAAPTIPEGVTERTEGQGDRETGGQGDRETGRQGDRKIGRQEVLKDTPSDNRDTGGQGDD